MDNSSISTHYRQPTYVYTRSLYIWPVLFGCHLISASIFWTDAFWQKIFTCPSIASTTFWHFCRLAARRAQLRAKIVSRCQHSSVWYIVCCCFAFSADAQKNIIFQLHITDWLGYFVIYLLDHIREICIEKYLANTEICAFHFLFIDFLVILFLCGKLE